MVYDINMAFYVLGTGSSVPQKSVSNDDLANIMDTSDEWIRTRTGIGSRRVVTTETATSLSVAAAKAAVQDAGIDVHDVDRIICSTLRGDWFTPAQACAVGEGLGIDVPAFDINAACSGLMYAFETADAMITSGQAETILIVTVEILSRLTDWKDRATCVLFGDGASALVVRKGEGLLATHIACKCNTTTIFGPSIGGDSPFIDETYPASVLHMNGQETYRFAVGTMIKEIETVLSKAGLATADVDWFLPHQANLRIIDAAASRMGIAKEKILTNIERYGNVSSTSIGILLDECAKKGTFRRGDKLLAVAFGAGLTSGAVLLEWKK